MKAMLLRRLGPVTPGSEMLTWSDVPEPLLDAGDVLIRVKCCGVCHTELDEIEGRTPPPHLPVILGHQVVGIVEAGKASETASLPSPSDLVGRRVGVAWIFSACGKCKYCLAGNENLCENFRATGRDADGGYAQYMKAPLDFVHPIPDNLPDAQSAPLRCAGAVGYRALRLTDLRDGGSLGLTGFGASNHLILKMVRHKFPAAQVFVFSRSPQEREFAMSLGAAWAGAIDEAPPALLDAVIDATPVWKPITEALKHLAPGGRLVVNAIRKENVDQDELKRLDYPTQLWMEKEIKSVANVTRRDVREFLALASEAHLLPEVQMYDLKDANRALQELRQGSIRGAKVLQVA